MLGGEGERGVLWLVVVVVVPCVEGEDVEGEDVVEAVDSVVTVVEVVSGEVMYSMASSVVLSTASVIKGWAM